MEIEVSKMSFEENLKRTEKAINFMEHIENHLKVFDSLYNEKREVCCKICGKTIDEINKELQSLSDKNQKRGDKINEY